MLKKQSIFLIFFIFTLQYLMVNDYTSFAGQQYLPESWNVRSDYHDPLTGNYKRTLVWKFHKVPAKTGYKVEVTENDDRLGTWARLYLDEQEKLWKIEVGHVVRGKSHVLSRDIDINKPVVIEDSIAPVDFLNIQRFDFSSPLEFKIVERVGGASFASLYKLVCEDISIKNVVSRNMISEDDFKLDIENGSLQLFRVIKITKNGETEVLSQLWSDKYPFWLYEATSKRTSRYIFD